MRLPAGAGEEFGTLDWTGGEAETDTRTPGCATTGTREALADPGMEAVEVEEEGGTHMEEHDPLPSWEIGVDCDGVAKGVDWKVAPSGVFRATGVLKTGRPARGKAGGEVWPDMSG